MQGQSTLALVQYAEQPKDTAEGLYVYIRETPPAGKPTTNIKLNDTTITVSDLRAAESSFKLKENGFELHNFDVPEGIEWGTKAEVEEKYYPLAGNFLKHVTGATRVHVFDHVVRLGHINNGASSQQRGDHTKISFGENAAAPFGRVHNDFSAKSGLERLAKLLPDEAAKLKETPFAIAQVWRPLIGPVQSSPLGIIDASTVDKEDFMIQSLHFPGRIGNALLVRENPNHRWYYTSEMKTDEAYVFICYDSRADGRACFTPHAGLVDHSSKPDAPARASIEIRAYIFFEDLPPQPYAPAP